MEGSVAKVIQVVPQSLLLLGEDVRPALEDVVLGTGGLACMVLPASLVWGQHVHTSWQWVGVVLTSCQQLLLSKW